MLQTIAAAIPFGRLTRPQVFDLAFDAIAGAIVLGVFYLRTDFGRFSGELRFVLVLIVLGFVFWSYRVNAR